LNSAKLRLIGEFGAGPKARKRYLALATGIRALRLHPCRYRRNPDLPGTRVFSVAGYRVIYNVHPDTDDNITAGDVRVLLVRHPGEP